PERLLGESYDGRADAYGVGVTLYQMISGRLPFQIPESAGIAGVIVKALHDAPCPLRQAAPQVSAAVEEVVIRALAKKPEQRLTVAEIAVLFSAAIGREGEAAGGAGAGMHWSQETVGARPKDS